MVLFGLFAWGANTYSKAAEEDKSAVMKRINQIDTYFQYCSCAAFVGVATLGWFLK
jgi:hypothetical protein